MDWRTRLTQVKAGDLVFVTNYGGTWEGIRNVMSVFDADTIQVIGAHGISGHINTKDYRIPTDKEKDEWENRQ